MIKYIFDQQLRLEKEFECYEFSKTKNDIALLHEQDGKYHIALLHSRKMINIPYIQELYGNRIDFFMILNDERILIKGTYNDIFIIDENRSIYCLKSREEYEFGTNPLQLENGIIAELLYDKIEFWKLPPNKTLFSATNFMRLHQL